VQNRLTCPPHTTHIEGITVPPLMRPPRGICQALTEVRQLIGLVIMDEDVAEICHRLQRVLGRDDFYWTVVPFGDDAREEFGGVLQDDLFDIYRDLRDPVDAGVAEAEAVWEWRFSFWTHWGEHLVDALRIIHLHLSADGEPQLDFTDE
jgi:Domain of unknown function (DUF5063)